MAVWKSIGSIYLLVWIIHLTSFWLVRRNATGYFGAHVMHLERVIRNNLLMVLGSFFVWKRVTSLLFETATPKQKGDEENDFRMRRSHRPASVSALPAKMKHVRPIVYAALAVFLFIAHFSQFFNYFANTEEPRWISMIGLTSFGIWVHLVAFLIGFSIANFLIRFIHSKSIGQMVLTPIFARYPFVQQLSTNGKWQTVMAIVLSVVVSVCLLIAAGYPRINRVEVKLKNLPKSMDGLVIALLTDMHAGPTVGRKAFTRAVEMTNAEKPDIVTIVGDLVDGDIGNLKSVVEPIGRLQSKYGVYFSTGNHEMYYGRVDDWIQYLQSLNVKVMRNENVKIRPGGTDKSGDKKKSDEPYLCLAGADDIIAIKTGIDGHRMDLRAAVNGCAPSMPTILMTHNPKAAKEALEIEQRIDLILCGHTHAGQLYILAPIMYMMMPFFYGLYEYRPTGTFVYVSSGVFYAGMPMKMFHMSEITLITLKSAPSS